jgi:outer membrane lipoprotein-sorting protein
MRKKLFSVLLIALVGAFNFSATLPENQNRAIANKMVTAMESYQTCVYTMRSEERLPDMKDLRGGEIFTKVNETPRKVYMKMTADPNKGTEVLYSDGENNGKATVKSTKLFFSISLAPTGGMLTKDQHHTLYSAGFRLVARIVKAGMKRSDEQGRFDEVFKYVGDVTWNNRPCYKLVIEDPTWAYTTYKAQKGETMLTIANKLLISEYSIADLNGVKSFDDDLGGKTLKVPTSYAKKSVFYIDKENNFPVFQELTDDRGVFERYQFFNLKINPAFKSNEFTKGFDGYNF